MNISSINIFIYILFLSSTLFGQKDILHSISGRIVDKASGAPIPYVNVFLDATTLGTSTNNKGFYKISNIPNGSYKIIASAIGFEKSSKNILTDSIKKLAINFKLIPKVYKLNEVSVIAEKDNEWVSNYNLFQREFLGTSIFAEECKILNPEILTFSKNEKIKLKAIASEPIKIRNNALGYKIFFDIKEFILYENKEFNYHGNIRFVELKHSNSSKLKAWRENRKSIFKGSFRHFLISLGKNKLLENGFRIFNVHEPNWDNLRRRNFTIPDYSKIIKNVTELEMDLEFYDNLMVVYDDWEEEGFQKYRNLLGSNIFKTLSFQTSWLNLPFSSVSFDINGNIIDDYSGTKLFGYWAWQRVAHLLPSNFKDSNKD